MTEKKILRQDIAQLKTKLTSSQKTNDANKVFSIIEKSKCFNDCNNILIYHSLPDELNTALIIEKWHHSKQLFLPRVNNNNLDIIKYDPKSIMIGSYNIIEPIGTPIPASEIDLIIVPGVAFDKSGNRLGRGKGFYDRLLHNLSAIKIGVGYDFQLIEKINTEPHDIAMDAIITPSNSIIFNNTIWQ